MWKLKSRSRRNHIVYNWLPRNQTRNWIGNLAKMQKELIFMGSYYDALMHNL